MTTAIRVVLLGFSEFERSTLASCFRLAGQRTPHYEVVDALADSDRAVANADHKPSLLAVTAANRMNSTVFIGAKAPAGSTAWMTRPIDPLNVMRELDAMPWPVPRPEPLPGTVSLSLPDDGQETAQGAQPPAAGPAITTPLQTPNPVAAAASVKGGLALAVPAAAVLPSPCALLVDDSEIALRFLETRLSPYGLHTRSAVCSGKAIEMLSKQRFDFVFVDVELGDGSDLDGLALCQHIKRHTHASDPSPAAVIMVSVHAKEIDRVRGALAGCDGYLGKPLHDQELQRLLKKQGLRWPEDGKSEAR